MRDVASLIRYSVVLALVCIMSTHVCTDSIMTLPLTCICACVVMLCVGDDVSNARSTFMIEMEETAYIMTHATPKSLIIMDEVGTRAHTRTFPMMHTYSRVVYV